MKRDVDAEALLEAFRELLIDNGRNVGNAHDLTVQPDRHDGEHRQGVTSGFETASAAVRF